jgi:release factor glutamine methyltransferase
MNAKQLKRVFYSELDSFYPRTEIDSFFYLLMEDYYGLKRVDLALNTNEDINIDKRFHSALNSLVEQKPIQYILGKTEFYGLEFNVNQHTLIPRPETEELVQIILDDLKSDEKLNILDIGTGSGCIAIALAKNLKNATVYALDISEKALEIAKENAKINHTEVHFFKHNILENKNLKTTVKFDVIVSNPPYVRELEKENIHKNVLNFEPHLALFVNNENPLLFYDKISSFALKHLNKGGKLYFEINQYLGDKTLALLKNKGFRNCKIKKDIFGNDRIISCEL